VRRLRLLFRAVPQPLRTGPINVYGPLLTLQARRHVRAFEDKRAAKAAASTAA